MRAYPILVNTNHTDLKSGLRGFSIRENAGTPAAASITLRDSAVGGPILAVLNLAASGSAMILFQDAVVVSSGGVYVQLNSGSVEGVLYGA